MALSKSASATSNLRKHGKCDAAVEISPRITRIEAYRFRQIGNRLIEVAKSASGDAAVGIGQREAGFDPNGGTIVVGGRTKIRRSADKCFRDCSSTPRYVELG